MKLTEKQKLLINGLQLLKINQRTIEVIMLACQTEKTTQIMLDYLVNQIENKQKITEEMLLTQIAKMD